MIRIKSATSAVLRNPRAFYSVISTQPTLASRHAAPISQPPLKLDNHEDNSHEHHDSGVTIPDINSLKDPTPISNLLKAKDSFPDAYGLHSKIALLVESLQNSNSPLRIGLYGSKPTFLNTILADPFASNQEWYNNFIERSNSQNLRVKYGDFSISDDQYIIPSPILDKEGALSHDVEFVEMNDHIDENCHFYISFKDNVTDPLLWKWPVYEYKDEPIQEVKEQVLADHEIDSELSFAGMQLLIQSPVNSSQYITSYNQSNIPKFLEFLRRASNPNVYLSKIYNRIIKNLEDYNISNSFTLDELSSKNERIKKYILQWDEITHKEFQVKFKKYVDEFEKKNLVWWKLYYRADDVEGLLKIMLNQGFLTESLNNYSYIKGSIDSFTSFKTLEGKVGNLDNELTKLRQEIITNELSTIQNQALKILALNVFGLQAPIVLCAIGGVAIYHFSFYSMFGLASLGVVYGFQKIAKSWDKVILKFKQDLFERVRLSIVKTNQSLIQDWNKKLEEESTEIRKRQAIIDDIKQDLK